MEKLEARHLLAGNVLATISQGDLYLTGDQAGNGVQISQLGTGSYKISGLTWEGAPTTINGQSSIIMNRLWSNLFVDLRQGNDALAITNAILPPSALVTPTSSQFRSTTLTIPQDLVISGGDGNDILALGSVHVGRDLLIRAGRGADHIFVAHSTIQDDMAAAGEAGNDQLTVAHTIVRDVLGLYDTDGSNRVTVTSTLAGWTEVNVGVDDDKITLIDLAVTWDLRLATWSGNDQVELTRVTARNVGVDMGTGNDSLRVSEILVGTDANFSTGDGADVIVIQAISTTGLNRIGRNLSVDAGAGNDVINIQALQVGQHMDLLAGSGNDQVQLNNTQVARNATFDMGDGTDTLAINALAADALFAKMGSGDRDFLLIRSTRAKRTTVDGGLGSGDKFEDKGGNSLGVTSISGFELLVRPRRF